ncbi:phenoloxidase-activating factor 2-like [Oratosquilla oratoria]|uniref:phenoloxidase-activating factor 2-like n=1 Tax=Oratosquilla oratoria TaxID=337810 RepID=UPI003F76D2ED
MRTLVLAVLLAVGSSAVPRQRRQLNGSFWWLTSTVPTPTARVSENNNRIVDTVDGSCECVAYYLCEEGEIITDGAGLIDIRFGNTGNSTRRSHSECPNFLDVCCRKPLTSTPKPETIYEPRCGQRNEHGVHARIQGFNDTQTQFGEFPWMTAVLRTEQVVDEEINLYVCGGSLIHPEIVLTAAHCVSNKNAENLKIRLGEWDTTEEYELFPHHDRYVKQVVIHPQFNPRNLHYDFALLHLESPADIGPNVDTVCLPGLNDVYDYANCLATGWGKDQFNNGKYQNILKKVQLPVVPNYDCETSLRTTRLGRHFILSDTFMCAGGETDVDTCKGDGGSPLVCRSNQDPNFYAQVGIVAWGIGCGENGVPGVYARVQSGLVWIDEEATRLLHPQGRRPSIWGYSSGF